MITVFCDGASRGNPGHAAFAFQVRKDQEILKEDAGYIGIATNNIAEYTAVLKALTWLRENCQDQNIDFYLDSNLVVFQLSGLYKIKNANLREIVLKIHALEANFPKIRYNHVPRTQNKEADKLANRALDKKIYGI